VVVIGGKNSAAEAALGFVAARRARHARPSRSADAQPRQILGAARHREPHQGGRNHAYFNSTVQEIGDDCVVLRTPSGPVRLKNDFVFALTGYHPDYDFLRSVGIELSPNSCVPSATRRTWNRMFRESMWRE
jgi:thioredoxin reductase (NADPH)